MPTVATPTAFAAAPERTRTTPDHVTPLLQFFEANHLPPPLRDVSLLFRDLAHRIEHQLPRNAEKTTALRKLLESKDCAVRAMLCR